MKNETQRLRYINDLDDFIIITKPEKEKIEITIGIGHDVSPVLITKTAELTLSEFHAILQAEVSESLKRIDCQIDYIINPNIFSFRAILKDVCTKILSSKPIKMDDDGRIQELYTLRRDRIKDDIPF